MLYPCPNNELSREIIIQNFYARLSRNDQTMLVLGNVAEIQNFLRITKINLWSNLATRGRAVHLHTLVDREAEALQERG